MTLQRMFPFHVQTAPVLGRGLAGNALLFDEEFEFGRRGVFQAAAEAAGIGGTADLLPAWQVWDVAGRIPIVGALGVPVLDAVSQSATVAVNGPVAPGPAAPGAWQWAGALQPLPDLTPPIVEGFGVRKLAFYSLARIAGNFDGSPDPDSSTYAGAVLGFGLQAGAGDVGAFLAMGLKFVPAVGGFVAHWSKWSDYQTFVQEEVLGTGPVPRLYVGAIVTLFDDGLTPLSDVQPVYSFDGFWWERPSGSFAFDGATPTAIGFGAAGNTILNAGESTSGAFDFLRLFDLGTNPPTNQENFTVVGGRQFP